jgi:hypothetical protein
MDSKESSRTQVKVGALVLTPNLLAVTSWLERYFGFESSIDWMQEDGAGLIYCRSGDEEVAVMGCSNLSDGEHSALVTLLVDDIEQIAKAFAVDDIECFFLTDAGERPTIEFERPSPYFMFSIQQR